VDARAFQFIGPGNWRHSRFFVGARSCLFGWCHRFQIASFSPSTLENSVFKKHRFQIAPLWRAISNDSVFGDRFRRCSVDDSRIRSKTAPFSFENGLVWTGPEINADNGFQLFFHSLLNFTCKQSRRNWTVLGKFAVVVRTHFFNIFKFLKSRNRKFASFGLLRNVTTRLHLNFLPKLRKSYKNIAFRGRPTATVL